MKAHVDSLEVLKSFRAALWKFSESSMAALAEAEGEVHRTLVWLETEQLIHWQNEIRKRHEWVEKCKEAYRQKTLFKDAAGTRSSGFDERKALDKAKRALEEAEEKYANTRRYVRVLQRELQNYTGSVQRFSTDVSNGLPIAVAKLEKMYGQLEAYVNAGAPSEVTSAATSSETSMSRGAGENTINIAKQFAQRSPSMAERAAGETAPSLSFLTAADPINAPARLAIATLNVKKYPAELSQIIVLGADIYRASDLYFHRMIAATSADSGWFIGAADHSEKARQFFRATIEDVLQIRPDWREILSLPANFIVVITAGSIANVYNENGQDLWTKRR